MKESICDRCKKETLRKHLGKIRGKFLCRGCRKETRIQHRKETIEKEGIAEELKELKNKIAKERGYSRKCYEKKVGYEPRTYKKNTDKTPPTPKGSKKQVKDKTQSYIGFNERQALFSILLKKGIDSEEAKERLKNLIESQKEIRKEMSEKNKSEKEIKKRQEELLEELWNL